MSKLYKIAILGLAVCLFLFTGCSPEVGTTLRHSAGEADPIRVRTDISYCPGGTNDWTEGSEKKVFDNQESCYVRIGSTALARDHSRQGEELTVTYRFTGACGIEVCDGNLTLHQTPDENVVEFTHILTAAKKKNAREDFVVFRYLPEGAESMVLEVFYEGLASGKFDQRSTIYFAPVQPAFPQSTAPAA